MQRITKELLGFKYPTRTHSESPPLRQTRNDPGQPRTFGSGIEPLLVVPVRPDTNLEIEYGLSE